MKKTGLVLAVIAIIGAGGCAHQTAMTDPSLSGLWNGNPIPETAVQAATERWKQDTALIEMQQAFALLRKGNLSADARKQAKYYLERAVASFDDLKEPNNFSKAFTADSNTPYRGRPYERVLASALLGILDIADGRCDMALPAFKTAEFLDARWQPFQFGSDAPLVYALSLRCLNQMNASKGDMDRAKDGLFRAIRLNNAVETLRDTIQEHAHDLSKQQLSSQISFLLIDAGISSALMEAPSDTSATDILDKIVNDSLRFYTQVLADKNDPLYESLADYAQKLESSIGSKDKAPSAQALVHMSNALKSLITRANATNKLRTKLEKRITDARSLTDAVSEAVMKPKAVLVFEGNGPKIRTEGEYNQIARIVPASEELARPGVSLVKARAREQCGVHQDDRSLTVVMCDEQTLRSEPQTLGPKQDFIAAKLWSSSYQATSMVGRRFDKVLKGRAEFRLGAEQTALIGAVAALSLLDSGNALQRECNLYGRNCDAARNLQMAGAIAGLIAGGAWLAGRAVNPEADVRHLTNTFESGYLAIRRKE